MLKTHEKLRIPDENKANDLIFEVNWAPKDAKSNECKLIRVHYPDGKTAVIKREHILSVIFAFSPPDEQSKLVPVKLSQTRWYETTIGITAKKDIRKGEKIVFPLKLTLPAAEQELMGITSKAKLI